MNQREKLIQLRIARAAGRRITVIGGGTGLSTLLLGLKEYTDNITAIVTVTDDGGSSGVLRREYNVLPPGDIRNCILSLANTSHIMGELLNYRFDQGSLAGQNFGNLFLLALNEVCGSFKDAVANMHQILAVTGKVLPVTDQNINLMVLFADGETVRGETAICRAKTETGKNIQRIFLEPAEVQALPEVIEAILKAEAVILGPGSLYTSIIPNLLVGGVSKALQETTAYRLYILNVMTQRGETEGYSVLRHIQELIAHAGENIMDACLFNTREIHKGLLNKYAVEGSCPLYPVEGELDGMNIRLMGHDVLSRSGQLARHDPLRLAHSIMNDLTLLSPREGELGELDCLILER